MIIRGTNPAHTLPNPHNVHKAMSNPDSCIVGIEAFPAAVTPQYAALARAPAFIFSPAPFSAFALQRATG